MLSKEAATTLQAMWDAYEEVCVGFGQGDDVGRLKKSLEDRFEGFLRGLTEMPSLANPPMEPEKPGGEGIHDCGNPNCMVTDWERLDRERESVDLEATVLAMAPEE